MQLINILLQFLFIFEIFILINGLFFSKSDKRDRHLIAAKFDREMPKSVRKVLEQVGDYPVLKIQLGRTPVVAFILFFLNLISTWKFSKKQIELGYDEIYHNYLLITIRMDNEPNDLETTDTDAEDKDIVSVVYKLEKAHRIRLIEPQYPEEFVDIYDIPLTPNKTFTLNRLISTASNVDKDFYTYDAGNNNMCQTFVENIVDINGLTSNIVDEKTRTALKPQDAVSLIATLGSRSDIVKRITDFGAIVDKLVTERKISWKPPVNKAFSLFGDMHVIITDENTDRESEEQSQSNNGAVTVNGSQHITLENEDSVFNAVVNLEEEDKAAQRNQKILIIVCVVVGIILLVAAAVAIAFFLWKKRKDKLRHNQSKDEKESASELSEVSSGSNTEELDYAHVEQ